MNSLTKFYDLPGNITLGDGVARIDMFDKHPVQDNDKEQKFVFSERIVLTMPGFIELYRLVSQAMRDLEKQGALTKPAAKSSLS